jgi:large subunit ribosomal protein L29
MANKKEKTDFREFSEQELRATLTETREKLFQMRFQSATAPLKNPHAINAARRDIARILTVMRQKGLAS